MPNGKRLIDREWFCKLLIVCAAVSWGASFFILKDVIAQLPVFFVLAFRFLLAGALTVLLFRKRVMAHLDRPTVSFGVTFGLLGFVGYVFQTYGLMFTTPGKNAFISGCYCVLVPFFAWLLGMGRPSRHHIIGAVLCMVGLGFVALDGGLPLNIGDVLTSGCAIAYGMQYALLARDGNELDTVTFTAVEFLVMGALCAVFIPVVGDYPRPEALTPYNIAAISGLALICSFAAFLSVNHAFSKVDPTSGALLSSLEAPIGVFFSATFANEVLTGRVVTGFVLIFLAILISEIGPVIIERITDSDSEFGRVMDAQHRVGRKGLQE